MPVTRFDLTNSFSGIFSFCWLGYSYRIWQKSWVCKIICVNHHRLFDTPVFCIMHNGFDNTVISWKKLVEKFLGGNDYVTEN